MGIYTMELIIAVVCILCGAAIFFITHRKIDAVMEITKEDGKTSYLLKILCPIDELDNKKYLKVKVEEKTRGIIGGENYE